MKFDETYKKVKVQIRDHPYPNCIHPYNKEAYNFTKELRREFLTMKDISNIIELGFEVEEIPVEIVNGRGELINSRG